MPSKYRPQAQYRLTPMAKKLLIVDRPNKAIGRILDSEEPGQWTVTVGFVYGLVPISRIMLPRSGELVQYETTEGQRKVLDNIREHIREDTDVYLATGPGLKGESHAWHLQRYLGSKNPKCVIFHEISSEGIKAALAKVRPINVQLVEAYEEHLSSQQHKKRWLREYISQLHPRDPVIFGSLLNCSTKESAEFERKRIISVEANIEWIENSLLCSYSLAATANQILQCTALDDLEKQAMLQDLEELAIDVSLWRKLVYGEPRKPVLGLPSHPKKQISHALSP